MRKSSPGLMVPLVVMGLVVAFFSSCATFDPNERLTSDDCLVLIPSTLVNTSGSTPARVYVLVFDNGLTIPIKNDSISYVAVHLRQPQSLVKLTSSVSGENMRGASSKDLVQLDIPYRPGEIVVFSRVFAQLMKKIGDNQYQTSWDLLPVTADVRAKVLEAFWGSSMAESWRGASVAPAETP